MLAADIPAKFPIPFANNASGAYSRPIPQASQSGGAASLTDGFPPVNFTPVSAGGIPPFGQDFNGILYQISAWSRWQNAGGTVPYDATFSSEIGGYPKGTLVSGAAPGVLWLSIVDNNATNPNTGGAGWMPLAALAGGVATIASAGTVDLGVTPQGCITISGAVTIASFGTTMPIGVMKLLTFSGTLTLTYSASLILPGGVDILTAPGDTALVECLSSGNYRVVMYQRASGGPVVPPIPTAPAGYIHGLTTSNDATTPASVLDIAPGGAASDDASSILMTLGSLFKKSIASNWVAGSGNGGLDTGTVANGVWYFPYIIGKADGSSDVLFSASPSAPTMPSGWGFKRRIGAFKYGTGAIVAYTQDGDDFNLVTPVQNISTSSTRSKANLAVSVPIGLRVKALLQVLVTSNGNDSTGSFLVYDGATGGSVRTASTYYQGNAQSSSSSFPEQYTDTAGNIQLAITGSVAGNLSTLTTLGWTDTRGQ